MNVGICTILPGQRQHAHVHHGEEQLVYILEGESVQIVDGKRHTLNQGMHLYMEAGVTHESLNTGERPIRELLVSNPIPYTQEKEEAFPIGLMVTTMDGRKNDDVCTFFDGFCPAVLKGLGFDRLGKRDRGSGRCGRR